MFAQEQGAFVDAFALYWGQIITRELSICYSLPPPPQRALKKEGKFNLWRKKCAFCAATIHRGISHVTPSPQLSLPNTPHRVMFVYSIPKESRFLKVYAFEQTFLHIQFPSPSSYLKKWRDVCFYLLLSPTRVENVRQQESFSASLTYFKVHNLCSPLSVEDNTKHKGTHLWKQLLPSNEYAIYILYQS